MYYNKDEPPNVKFANSKCYIKYDVQITTQHSM